MTYLGDKAVGDIVKINENGSAVNYIIVHKGKPSSDYDDSCDGVWLLRQARYGIRAWDGTSASDCSKVYNQSDIDIFLNSSYLNRFDEDIRNAIKTVRVPYTATDITDELKIFLLSGYEVGLSETRYMMKGGAKLDYFIEGTSAEACDLRKLAYSGSDSKLAYWYLRSCYSLDIYVWYIAQNGGCSTFYPYVTSGVRPAFIMPANLTVDDDGFVKTNNLPTITADKTGDLGTLDSGFSCVYSVDDADESDSVSVTLDLDGVQISTFTATKNQQETYTLGGNEWLKVTNGEHTFTITASDGKDASTNAITFTRNLTELTVTLAQPFPADDVISACALNVEGSIPADAVCKYEVTNNALDTEPVWEDCTAKSKAGFSYVFTNKTAENGFAFNFRVTISRGASGSGGYISSISGGFE